MPWGRALGLALGWRLAFGVVGAVSAFVAVSLAFILPKIPAGEPFTLGKLPALMRNRRRAAMYAVTVLVATAYYTG